ncbi:hypothetical protein SCLCIDRAFT_1149508 [Scleroderma citrinum Foug A]|uniref:Uncharacterized protein n=1 Tax=Scleroderma citrinum Foug A TaxID=1036808 RepID=A0A0C2ZST2_9AGAM|nr:hypothetical protein SCLCIDRAFT_1149508 [Scleroderma citrinum Foug A]
MLQLEHDWHQGQDYSLNFKAVNPTPSNLSRIYILQAQLSNQPGHSSMLQLEHDHTKGQDYSLNFKQKYTGSKKDWIATAQAQLSRILLQTTYWHKLSDKVEVTADLQVLSALLEQKFAPTFMLLVSGEIDHFKLNAAKVGIGVIIESSNLPPEEMGMPPQLPMFKHRLAQISV